MTEHGPWGAPLPLFEALVDVYCKCLVGEYRVASSLDAALSFHSFNLEAHDKHEGRAQMDSEWVHPDPPDPFGGCSFRPAAVCSMCSVACLVLWRPCEQEIDLAGEPERAVGAPDRSGGRMLEPLAPWLAVGTISSCLPSTKKMHRRKVNNVKALVGVQR